MINIEVVYATPDQQKLIAVKVPENATVQEVITLSGILQQYPEIDLTANKVGIFSKIVKLDAIVRDGDRIEIYRPLLIDPMQARLLRARKKKM